MVRRYLFTSGNVTEGHPDKICDQISDSILDEFLRQDKDSHVAVESMTTTGIVFIAGEISSRGRVDVQKLFAILSVKSDMINQNTDLIVTALRTRISA